jgi:hypothetical protein
MGPVSTASLSLLLLLSRIVAGAQNGTPTPKQPASTTLSCDRFHKTGFWDVDIQNWPALAPDCGAPLSRNALRDRSKLPIQISGIIASYLIFIAILGILLVTVGRKSRNKAQGTVEKRPVYDIEMVKPSQNFEPLSPAYSQRSWMRAPFKTLKNSALSKASSFAGSPIEAPSPAVASITSFDGPVVDVHLRESRQAELERLYAAVMVHEDAKRSTGQLSLAPSVKPAESIAPSPPTISPPTMSPPTTIISPPTISPPALSPPVLTLPKNPMEAKRKLRVQIADAPPQHFEPQPKSPYRAIYPPDQSPDGDGQSMMDASPMTPITPRRAGQYVLPRQQQHDNIWPLPSPGPGPLSPMRIELPNDMYPASPAPRQVQMQLPPIQQPTPPPAADRQSSSSGSGRSRKLGLKNLRISAPQKDEFDDRQPLTPRTYTPGVPPNRPAYGVRFQEPQLSAKSVESYTAERLDEPQPLPMPTAQPQRRPPNLTLTLPPGPGSTKSTSSPVGALPLRAFQNASAENLNPLSPGIKTTYLEKKLEKIGRGPQTGRTPRTGMMPQTPYSAYMPFTPMTPVTPGLMSRKDRKERIKAQGRQVLLEEDEVKDNEEMWDM